ncbi:hypothetical protein KXW28_009267 [Aspergillus fumigatus]|nr:hypothetical protein KXX32_001623 [Aspergillus fumigatus]KAH1462732.1 hypothetical protein KXX58_007413 [Aspergillus fumigatus]KAH1538851.1 hypothetical protein KXX61_007920 [Aspergillus fumigatus]KAH1690850.1 hypothetical protein KXX12_009272 [Aspergillus fumigatus]KAH1969566.1 hypothetical protein KXV80_001289 [Aspergillus fumigatus]
MQLTTKHTAFHKTDNSHPSQASHAESAHSHSQTQQRQCGRVAGGKYLQGLYDDHTFTPSDGPIQKVDVDMPLTLTETIYHNGNQYLAPFCEGELTGRCVVSVGAYLLFAIMFSGLALGQNIVTIIVCRALLGLFGCVGTILVGGTFDDMYTPNQRAVPMATFSYIAILGTVGAPIYAGFIDETLGWRWISRKCSTIPPSKAIHILATKPALLGFGLWFSLAWFLTSSSSPSSPSPSRKKTPGARALPVGSTLYRPLQRHNLRLRAQLPPDQQIPLHRHRLRPRTNTRGTPLRRTARLYLAAYRTVLSTASRSSRSYIGFRR